MAGEMVLHNTLSNLRLGVGQSNSATVIITPTTLHTSNLSACNIQGPTIDFLKSKADFSSNTAISATTATTSLSNYSYSTLTPASAFASNASVWSSNNLLPKSGGTITGSLAVSSNLDVNGTITATSLAGNAITSMNTTAAFSSNAVVWTSNNLMTLSNFAYSSGGSSGGGNTSVLESNVAWTSNNLLPKSGGTITGSLIVSSNLDVNGTVTATTLEGNTITSMNTTAAFSSNAAAWSSNNLTTLSNNIAVLTSNIDWTSNNLLPKSGGTITGSLTVSTNLNVNGTVTATALAGNTITTINTTAAFSSNAAVWSSNNLLNKNGNATVNGSLTVNSNTNLADVFFTYPCRFWQPKLNPAGSNAIQSICTLVDAGWGCPLTVSISGGQNESMTALTASFSPTLNMTPGTWYKVVPNNYNMFDNTMFEPRLLVRRTAVDINVELALAREGGVQLSPSSNMFANVQLTTPSGFTPTSSNTSAASYNMATAAYNALSYFTASNLDESIQAVNPNTLYTTANITTANKLGVGTSNPGSIVHIRQDAFGALGPVLNIMNGGSGGASAAIDMNCYVAGPGFGIPSAVRLAAIDSNYSAHFVISNKVAGAFSNALVERIRLAIGGNVGIGTSTPSTLLHVNGTVTAASVTQTSDSRKKKDLEPINNALSKIQQLTGYTFAKSNADSEPDKVVPRYAGLIAQDVEQVLPEVVHRDGDGFLGVSYANMVGLLVEGIKELAFTLSNVQNNKQ